jgi:hypothetical protein
MGEAFADPEVVKESLDLYRDLWVSLYEVDLEYGRAFNDANPS